MSCRIKSNSAIMTIPENPTPIKINAISIAPYTQSLSGVNQPFNLQPLKKFGPKKFLHMKKKSPSPPLPLLPIIPSPLNIIIII